MELVDIQKTEDQRKVALDQVGVCDLKYPITVLDNTEGRHQTIATVSLSVALPARIKGTHMSRFIEVLNAHGRIMHVENIPDIVRAMQARLHARSAHLEMEFPFFLTKRAPVTGQEGVMDYTARFSATGQGRDMDFVLTVVVGLTTLCPCSKAISRQSAHNQRGYVTVSVRSRDIIWIEDLIALVETCGSSELYSLLKRPDEKAVTERAYENPVFVEDVVRNVALKLNEHPLVTWYRVEAENHESIHSHNAYACIERG